MGVREIARFLQQWRMDARDLRRRTIPAPTPRERERWYALWLLAQGWTATAEALERDPHTIGRWAAAFGEGGSAALIFEQSAPPLRPQRGAAGGVEGGGAGVARRGGHWLGQLDASAGRTSKSFRSQGSQDRYSRIEDWFAAGTYTIESTTYEAGRTGSFTMTISGP